MKETGKNTNKDKGKHGGEKGRTKERERKGAKLKNFGGRKEEKAVFFTVMLLMTEH